MYTLYARPGSGSAAVEAVLAECGKTFTIVDLPRGLAGQELEAYLAINPRGEVPTLQLPDNSLMTESAAIVIYLADLHREAGLAPDLHSPLRARYLRWMLYFASAVYMADLRYYYPARYSVDANVAEGIKRKAVKDMERDFAIFAKALEGGPFILGAQFSAVDIYATMIMSWVPDIDLLFSQHPNLKAYYSAVAQRPHVAKAWRRNEMPTV